MRTLATLAGAASLVAISSAAFAAGYEDVVIEPAPAPAPVVVVPTVSDDWTGFYAGVNAGWGAIDTDIDEDDFADDFGITADEDADDFNTYGVHAGYLYDLGSWVLGGEVEWAQVNFDDDSFFVEDEDDGGDAADSDVARFKVRAGYDAGSFLPYATAGAARLSTEIAGEELEDTGAVYGVGVDYSFRQNFVVGAEYLRHSFEDFDDSGEDFDANTLSLRASFSF